MTEAETTWLAGLLEGEGYFRAIVPSCGRKGRATLRVEVTMCDRDVVERVHSLTEATGSVRRCRPGRKNWSTPWRVTLAGQQAEDVMRAVLPYMGERRSAKIRECLAQNLSHHPRLKEEPNV